MGKHSDCHGVYTKAIVTAPKSTEKDFLHIMELDDNCHPSNARVFLLMNGMYTVGGLLHHVVYYRVDGQHCDQSTERRLG